MTRANQSSSGHVYPALEVILEFRLINSIRKHSVYLIGSVQCERAVKAWIPPPPGSLKFTVHGAPTRKPRPAGIAGVMRDKSHHWKELRKDSWRATYWTLMVVRDKQGIIRKIFCKTAGILDSNTAYSQLQGTLLYFHQLFF